MKIIYEFARKTLGSKQSSILILMIFSLMLHLNIEANDANENNNESTQILALELETSLWNSVVANNIPAISALISEIFQGLIPDEIITTKDDYVVVLSNIDLVTFTFDDFIAKRDRNVLVISYILTGIDSQGREGSDNIVSVWQKVDKHHDDCGCLHLRHRKRHKHSSSGEKWVLVSQSIERSSQPETR